MEKIIVITGGTSGIGLSTLNCFVKNGYKVYELSRREKGENTSAVHIPTDVTKEEQVRNAINFILEKEGKIHLLINNAGYGISGAIEFTSAEKAKQQFDVNFFGMVNVNLAVLPVMRQQGFGKIINISSVAAPIAIPFQAYYSASKAAIKSYSMALANEVKPFGIQVSTILPGDIKTGFTNARQKIIQGDDIYNGRISRSVAVMEHDEQNGMSSDTAGKMIYNIAIRKKIKPVYTLGLKYKLVILLTKILSERMINFIVRLIYAK
ncbi:MAG: SDR family NAD(P)-dependent oxidoreductase [Treponema sp.]|nr:SDR family NAD(P)-dependent oxidoreductase [Treponema sp.]